MRLTLDEIRAGIDACALTQEHARSLIRAVVESSLSVATKEDIAASEAVRMRHVERVRAHLEKLHRRAVADAAAHKRKR